jgi:hypothetical protein
VEEGMKYCYSCGKTDVEYSNSQKSKNELGRCVTCVHKGVTEKFQRFKPTQENNELTNAVGDLNLDEVKRLLISGSNPNYIRQAYVYTEGLYRLRFHQDGSRFADIGEGQPTTPLKLCVFRYSDCLLTDAGRDTLIKIANELIQAGANAEEGLNYCVDRYGDFAFLPLRFLLTNAAGAAEVLESPPAEK